ncbi:LPP20 family lipoprotein [Chryseolinea lacunae]|uniref:LPP20 family lipoprotein n=1 Tax=Chryseolinea lacunae TaxID=2801331 RepID=A0ABS1KTA6_9BACT|nr:LPP20 family lipoprotein [Chryseolinea lacunae]
MKRFFAILIVLAGCSPKVQPPDPESLKPSWLKTTPYQDGFYTGIGHSVKDGSNNYIQSAKKSALDDLVSQIKVNVSSTSVLSQLELDKKLTEQYEQIIQTTAADEIEEFELVDAWEDTGNYWVYYRLSIARYRQIKEEQKRNAVLLATDYLQKARQAEKVGDRLPAVSFYFQAFRSLEKYLGEAIRVTVDDKEVLLVNEIYASLQNILDKINIRVTPSEITLNRRVNQSTQTVSAKASYKDTSKPAAGVPLFAGFEKGAGDVYPTYKADDAGQAKILLTKIGSKDLEQTVGVKVDIDALSGSSSSPIYALIAKTLNVPRAQVELKVQRPIVYVTAEERSLGQQKAVFQITNKLKNLLANNGFEFTEDKKAADLWFDVRADSEKGSVTGSIYVTYLTSVIKVSAVKEGKEIYATTLDRIKGYGLDYDKSSVDAYNKTMETLEKERMNELLNTVLQ